MWRRLGFELLWAGVFLVTPLLFIVCLELGVTHSPRTVWQRLLEPEDICSYGWCMVLPVVVYLSTMVSRLARWIDQSWMKW